MVGSAACSVPARTPRGDERADAALVAIALGDDARAQRAAEARRPRDARPSPRLRRAGTGRARPPSRAGAAGSGRRSLRAAASALEQPIGGAVLAEEEQLVLAAEVVIQVAGRQVGGDGDVAHAGGGEAARAEDPRRGAHDLHAPGVGPFRTTVRKLNHGSIVAQSESGDNRRSPRHITTLNAALRSAEAVSA